MISKQRPEKNNSMVIMGDIVSKIEFKYHFYEEDFYGFDIATRRTSGMNDVVPVVISEILLMNNNIAENARVRIWGDLRTYNERMDEYKSKLKINVFAKGIEPTSEEEDFNEVNLKGYICKRPTYRTTPLGREISDVLLAVNRRFGRSDYIPCIFWGRDAILVSGLEEGQGLTVKGRFQSRSYAKKKEGSNEIIERTAYEVSINEVRVRESRTGISEMQNPNNTEGE